jgi:hypothetical protein
MASVTVTSTSGEGHAPDCDKHSALRARPALFVLQLVLAPPPGVDDVSGGVQVGGGLLKLRPHPVSGLLNPRSCPSR